MLCNIELKIFFFLCLNTFNCTTSCYVKHILSLLTGRSYPIIFCFPVLLQKFSTRILHFLTYILHAHDPRLMSCLQFYRQELCPEKRMLYYPYLPKVIGSDFLERRLRDIHSNRKDGAACHVFGHTHFCWDSVVDEIRY